MDIKKLTNKVKTDKKYVKDTMIETFYEMIRGGYAKPKGMSEEEFISLSRKEQLKVGVDLTEKGIKLAGSDNWLRDLDKKNSDETGETFYNSLVEELKVNNDTGEINIKLTEEGAIVKAKCKILGINFASKIQAVVEDGVDRLYNQQGIFINEEKVIEGSRRHFAWHSFKEKEE